MDQKESSLQKRDQAAAKRRVELAVSQPAFDALAAEVETRAAITASRMESAVRLYLNDKGAGRPAWPYPSFLQGSETAKDVGLELEIDEALWRSFEAEAAEQSVSLQQLAEHAAFYYSAEVDAGRITQRILDDPASAESD